jgi:hypothetical protein
MTKPKRGSTRAITKDDLVVFGNPDSPGRLANVTLCVNQKSARLIGDFLIKCADEMAENDEWDHVHLWDQIHRWNQAGIQLDTECNLVVMTTAIVYESDG